MKSITSNCFHRSLSPHAFSFALAALILSGLMQAAIPQTVWAQYEKPVAVDARTVVEPEILNGKYHSMNSRVESDGFFYHYRVKSTFGDFSVVSTGALRMLIEELAAIAAMKLVETDDTLMASLKQSGENTVTGLKNLAYDPQGTLEGATQGFNSLFNQVKGTIGRRKTTSAEDSKLEQVIGVSKSKGEVATQYGVSVYSRNPVLQEELDRLAMADYFGGLGIHFAPPSFLDELLYLCMKIGVLRKDIFQQFPQVGDVPLQ